MTYQTCVGCVHGTGFCQAREDVKAQVKGLGVTSLKWKCKSRNPIYVPGDAVWVNLFVGMEDHGDSWYDEVPTFAEFPGTIIEVKGSKAIAFIDPDAKDRSEEYDFVPTGNGHVKVTTTRMRSRDAAREDVCSCCKFIVRLAGHQDYCRNQAPEQRKAEEYQF